MPGQIVYGQLLVTVNVQLHERQRKGLERKKVKKIHGFGIISIGKTVVPGSVSNFEVNGYMVVTGQLKERGTAT